MRQTMGEWCLTEDGVCQPDHLATYGVDLFGTLWRSCFTVFRCLTEGCTSPDGTPLLIHIMMSSWAGTAMVMLYTLVFLAVTFGLFNLILAVFVEHTMAS